MLLTLNVFVFRLLGGLFLALGAIGLFLPVWPTTIFWIFAAICFARSSPEARDWIYKRPGIGPTIEDFVERGEISRPSKIAAITGIGLSAALSSWLLRESGLILPSVLVILLLVALYVAFRREPETPDN